MFPDLFPDPRPKVSPYAFEIEEAQKEAAKS
jgi:hypothetical protein